MSDYQMLKDLIICMYLCSIRGDHIEYTEHVAANAHIIYPHAAKNLVKETDFTADQTFVISVQKCQSPTVNEYTALLVLRFVSTPLPAPAVAQQPEMGHYSIPTFGRNDLELGLNGNVREVLGDSTAALHGEVKNCVKMVQAIHNALETYHIASHFMTKNTSVRTIMKGDSAESPEEAVRRLFELTAYLIGHPTFQHYPSTFGAKLDTFGNNGFYESILL
jgi:hypothetical protein